MKSPPQNHAIVPRSTYQLLVGSQDFRPTILFIQLLGHVVCAMLLQASLHAINGAPAHFEATMNRSGIKARLEQLFYLLLDLWCLFARARHFAILNAIRGGVGCLDSGKDSSGMKT